MPDEQPDEFRDPDVLEILTSKIEERLASIENLADNINQNLQKLVDGQLQILASLELIRRNIQS